MEFKEKTISSTEIYDGKIFKLKKDEVLLPNGKKGVREYVVHNGGCGILAELDGKILLVRQFRYPYDKEIWEIPAGKINAGEDPETTAIRELEEEGGIKAKGVKLLFNMYPTPAYSTEITRIYQAFDFEKSQVKLDEDEFLESKWFDKKTLSDMINKGEIVDGKTLIALLYILK